MDIKGLILQIVGNTLVQVVGKCLAICLSFISIVLLTRYLGTSGYGNYTLVFSYLAFFSLIGDFGLQYIAVKEIASLQSKLEVLLGTYFILRFVLVICSGLLALIFLIAFPYSTQLKTGIIIGALAVSVAGMTGYFNTIFQAKVRLDLLTLLDLLSRFSSVIMIVIFIYFKFSFYYIISSVLIGNIISFVSGCLLLPKSIKITFDKQIAKKFLKFSIPVGITALLSTLYFKLDAIILSLLKNSTDVGLYSLSYKILENITLFWFFYVSTIYPLLAKFKNENSKNYRNLLRSSMLLAIIISLPIVIIAFLLAPFVVILFGGKEFIHSADALRILLFSLPFIFVNTLFYNFYILEEFNIVIIIGMVISLVFNVVANLIFIPHFSYIAASYITILSEIILALTYTAGLNFVR